MKLTAKQQIKKCSDAFRKVLFDKNIDPNVSAYILMIATSARIDGEIKIATQFIKEHPNQKYIGEFLKDLKKCKNPLGTLKDFYENSCNTLFCEEKEEKE